MVKDTKSRPYNKKCVYFVEWTKNEQNTRNPITFNSMSYYANPTDYDHFIIFFFFCATNNKKLKSNDKQREQTKQHSVNIGIGWSSTGGISNYIWLKRISDECIYVFASNLTFNDIILAARIKFMKTARNDIDSGYMADSLSCVFTNVWLRQKLTRYVVV